MSHLHDQPKKSENKTAQIQFSTPYIVERRDVSLPGDPLAGPTNLCPQNPITTLVARNTPEGGRVSPILEPDTVCPVPDTICPAIQRSELNHPESGFQNPSHCQASDGACRGIHNGERYRPPRAQPVKA